MSEIEFYQPGTVAVTHPECRFGRRSPFVLESAGFDDSWSSRYISGTGTRAKPAAEAFLAWCEDRGILDSIDTGSLIGLRDRALIAVMIYSFARIEAMVSLAVEDFCPERRQYWIRLNEKDGRVNKMPSHHNLEAYLHEYIEAAELKSLKFFPIARVNQS